MALDFNKLTRPKSSTAPIDPLEIFSKTPNLPNVPNDLWTGQAESLIKWHENRNRNDNLILLNTGAGKSIVGILIAQSLVNEANGPVVFACGTIDLVEQTARECDRLGILYTKRVGGTFSNDLYETGKAFCITTYQALFVSSTTFTNEKAPSAVIFDDAHVSERIIRDVFTVTIEKSKYTALYNEIIKIVTPEFEALGRRPHLDFILEDIGHQRVTMCPPATSFRNREAIIAAVKNNNFRDSDYFFQIIRIWDNLDKCAIFVSPTSIEITPPFIPTGIYDILGPSVRRVYLSATMEFETDFVRGFGLRPTEPIAPDNDAGNGERLILLGSRFNADHSEIELAADVLKQHKIVVSVPSYSKAAKWKDFNAPPERSQFTQQLQSFRSAHSGAFILVSRIDGIDLPQDTCRVMLIDGAPSGSSLMEGYLSGSLLMNNLYSTKMAGRITQLFGRINRGRSDYSAFVIYGKDINIWLKTDRNVALLPPLIRKQVILSQTVQEGAQDSDEKGISSLISQVISRDQGWMEFYRDTIDGLDVPDDDLRKVRERESQLAASALAECRFMTRIWQNDYNGAREHLLDIIDRTAMADAKLAGWYSLWLAASYEWEGDIESAIAHYKKARARLSHYLNVPFKSAFDRSVESEGVKTAVQQMLLHVNHHGAQALGNLIGKLKAQANVLEDAKASSNAKEEAVRTFGELIGYAASRPDNEFGRGPDVIWKDENTSYLVAFELKTEKKNPAEYNKNEVGQSFNHIQWVKDNEPEMSSDGLLIIGNPGVCTPEASPSPEIFLVETSCLIQWMRNFAAKVDDIRGRTSIERYSLIENFGGLPEWQLNGFFETIDKNTLAAP